MLMLSPFLRRREQSGLTVALIVAACSTPRTQSNGPDGSADTSLLCDPSAPAVCPASEPAQGAPCTACGLDCCYGDQRCGGGTKATCVDGRWAESTDACGPSTLICPEQVPVQGGPCTCDQGLVSCNYGCSGALLLSGDAAAVATCPLGSWEISETAGACKDAGFVFDAGAEPRGRSDTVADQSGPPSVNTKRMSPR
jgi:hypothetical protein